jgi:MFS family permease
MLISSIIAGQLISRQGRYKIFPIIGTGVTTIGLVLLSRMTPATSLTTASILMMVLGLGLGMVMQVLILAAQNAVDYGDLGVATSGATLFRLIGGSVGTAALGAIFTARMNNYLINHLDAALTPAGAGTGVNLSPRAIAAMPGAVRDAYANAVTVGLSRIFLVAAVIGAIGFVLIWLLPEKPLRETVAARAGDVGDEIGEVFPMPSDTERGSGSRR